MKKKTNIINLSTLNKVVISRLWVFVCLFRFGVFLSYLDYFIRLSLAMYDYTLQMNFKYYYW